MHLVLNTHLQLHLQLLIVPYYPLGVLVKANLARALSLFNAHQLLYHPRRRSRRLLRRVRRLLVRAPQQHLQRTRFTASRTSISAPSTPSPGTTSIPSWTPRTASAFSHASFTWPSAATAATAARNTGKSKRSLTLITCTGSRVDFSERMCRCS